MPKTAPQRVKNRDDVTVPGGGGRIGTPAAANVSGMGDMGGGQYISRGDDFNIWRAMSPTLDAMIRYTEKEESRQRAEADKIRNKAEAEMEARAAAVDRISGAVAGVDLLADIQERTRLGKLDYNGAAQEIKSFFEGNTSSSSFSKGLLPFAEKALIAAQANDSGRKQEAEFDSYAALTRQGFRDLHNAYDPDRPEEYAKVRNELFSSRDTLGIAGSAINEMEMFSLENTVRKFASSEPARAQALLDLAEQKRPDGSPSLAASLGDGYTRLEKLRDELAVTVLAEASREKTEATASLKNTTEARYMQDYIAVSRLESPDVVRQWETDNIKTLTPEQLIAKYGEHTDDIMRTIKVLSSSKAPEGNEEALSEYSIAIQRGDGDWDAVRQDSRLNDKQRAQLFGIMKETTQKAELGYVPDAAMARKLLIDLESQWSGSVYETPWMATRETEPGKPPLVTPEGIFYQGELFKRLRQLDPKMDVTESNRMKQEMTRDLANEILSGRLRFQEQTGRTGEQAPRMRLSERLKEGGTLSPVDVSNMAKVYAQGGQGRVREVFGVDFMNLAGQERRRVMGEIQKRKAELDAIKANSLFGGGNKIETFGRYYSSNPFGIPEYYPGTKKDKTPFYPAKQQASLDALALERATSRARASEPYRIVVEADRLPPEE